MAHNRWDGNEGEREKELHKMRETRNNSSPALSLSPSDISDDDLTNEEREV